MAPFGGDQIPELRSVFEWPHLNVDVVFLDIQCIFLLPLKVECDANRYLPTDRMPTVIGNFISRRVYSSKLLTQHNIQTPTCCRFVDVRDGKEVKTGFSWTVRTTSRPQAGFRRLC